MLHLDVICTRGKSQRTRLRDCTVEAELVQFAISVSERLFRPLFLLLFVLLERQRDDK